MPQPPSESECRRPDFRGGIGVVMADGVEWFVPRPRVLLTLDDTESGITSSFDLGPEYQALHESVREGSALTGLMKMFAYLLRLNYDLDTTAVQSLVVVSTPGGNGDEETAETDAQVRFLALRDIAMGYEPAPKTFPDGSA